MVAAHRLRSPHGSTKPKSHFPSSVGIPYGTMVHVFAGGGGVAQTHAGSQPKID